MGSRNHYVIAAQNICKYNLGRDIDVDGIFGPNTHRAVEAYQSRYGLDVDGIVGPNTWAHMQTRLSGYNDTPRKVTGLFQIRIGGSTSFTPTYYYSRLAGEDYRWDVKQGSEWKIIRY